MPPPQVEVGERLAMMRERRSIPPSIPELARSLRDGSRSARDITVSCLDKLTVSQNELGAFHHIAADAAMMAAARVDADLAIGVDRGPLQGIPYAVVDVVDVAAMPTRCGSRLRAGHVARENARIVDRLAAAGAICLGKAATFEFATGAPGPDSLFPPARNPWDFRRSPGASGAGAAVAAGLVAFAVGLDTGGAVRVSAAMCGVAGLKPTRGLLSLQGVVPLAESLDHCGLLAATVEDLTIILASIAEAKDAARGSVAGAGVARLVLGVAADLPGVDPLADKMVGHAASVLAAAGAQCRHVRLAGYEALLAVGDTIYARECHAVHAQDLHERPHLFGERTRARIAAGASVSGADYARAQQERQALTVALEDGILAEFDAILLPTTPMGAPAVDAYGHAGGRTGALTFPFNVTGHPAVSIPCGWDADGLPLGLQIVGRCGDDATVLQIAQSFEQATSSSRRLPSLKATEGELIVP